MEHHFDPCVVLEEDACHYHWALFHLNRDDIEEELHQVLHDAAANLMVHNFTEDLASILPAFINDVDAIANEDLHTTTAGDAADLLHLISISDVATTDGADLAVDHCSLLGFLND